MKCPLFVLRLYGAVDCARHFGIFRYFSVFFSVILARANLGFISDFSVIFSAIANSVSFLSAFFGWLIHYCDCPLWFTLAFILFLVARYYWLFLARLRVLLSAVVSHR